MYSQKQTQLDQWIIVSGFGKDLNRGKLKSTFEKFGRILRIYINNSAKYAKIYFENHESCRNAFEDFRNNLLGWIVEYSVDPKVLKHTENRFKNCPHSQSRSKTMDYEGDFSENFNYCTIHGQPIVVLEDDSGGLYVNLKDVRKAGFAIFRRDTFDSVLVDKRQINKEFDLHLLSEAKNYILRNRAHINEEQILETIERCKSKLLGKPLSPQANRRSVVLSEDSHNMTITSNTEQPSLLSSNPNNYTQRPPRSLLDNVGATYSNKKSQGPSKVYCNNQVNSKLDSANMNGCNTINSLPNKQRHSSSNSSLSSGSYNQRKRSRSRPRQSKLEMLESHKLVPGTSYKVNICHMESDKICWVRESSFTKNLQEMLLDTEPTLEVLLSPQVGQLVVALYDDIWQRARIISVEPLNVHYLDYGNKGLPKVVKILPEKYKKLPCAAVRVVVNKTSPITEGDVLCIKVRQQYESGTYLVDVVEDVSAQHDETLSEMVYFKTPAPMSELKEGDVVLIHDLNSNKLCVKTKECCKKSKELIEYIKNLDKSLLKLQNVKKGQLVLCSKDGLVGLYRAIVTSTESSSLATVKYLDYSGEDTLSIKSLRNVDKYLSEQLVLLLETPEIPYLANLTPEAEETIRELVENKSKLKVVTDGQFDLLLEDGTLLSERINLKCEEKVDMKEERIVYDDMKWIEADVGVNSYFCYTINDLNDLTLISLKEESINYVEQVSMIDVKDEKQYEPKETEMCLVAYKAPEEQEASWYRGVVFLIKGNEFVVSCVDFGNQVTVTKKDIRKFPVYLKDVPILGINCTCVGIPHSEHILTKLKQLVPEGTQVEVDIKEFSEVELKYKVEFPELYKKLKESGLI